MPSPSNRSRGPSVSGSAASALTVVTMAASGKSATRRNSNAISRRSNAAGPDASVLEWPRAF